MGAAIGHARIHRPYGSSNRAYICVYIGHMGAALGHVYAHT